MLDQTNDPGGKLINFGGKREGHVGEDNAVAALKQVTSRYTFDPSRIYVTGNSMGGMGAWQMLLDYNAWTGTKDHIFAAGMPLAGAQRTADPSEAAKALRQVPIWSIHGAQDKEVNLDWDRAMARLMKGQRQIPLYRGRRCRTRCLGHLLHAVGRLGLDVRATRQDLNVMVQRRSGR